MKILKQEWNSITIPQGLLSFKADGRGQEYNLFPNLIFTVGTSYNTSIGMFGLNLNANISILKDKLKKEDT